MNHEKQSKPVTSAENQDQSVSTDTSAKDAKNLNVGTSTQETPQEKSPFEVYCDNNPDAAECRIYED